MDVHSFGADSQIVEGLTRLQELALNLRWTWDRETRRLFRDIYPALWDHIEDNPWLVLCSTSRDRHNWLLRNPEFRARIDEKHAELQRCMADRSWFRQSHPDEGDALIAYFTAECGLSECPPIYAGGRGILSGD